MNKKAVWIIFQIVLMLQFSFLTNIGSYQDVQIGDKIGFVGDFESDVLYSSYFGGESNEYSYSFALDKNDNIWITGLSESNNLKTTTGVNKPIGTGIFLSEFSNDGSTLLFSTWLGPGTVMWESYRDFPSIVIDSKNNVIVSGTTKSNSFPTTENAIQNNITGERDAFISILSNKGQLLYSTFLGGTGSEFCSGLSLDRYDDIYISGVTNSSDLPVTSKAFDRNLNGSFDIFIGKFSYENNSLEYLTYLGGSGVENIFPTNLAFDSSNNLIIAGDTLSTDYPTTVDAMNGSYNGGKGFNLPKPPFISNETNYCCGDIVLTKLSQTGNLVYSSFLGGSGNEKPHGLTTDTDGNIFITGSTNSTNFPTTKGSFDRINNGDASNNYGLHFFFGDAFVTKLTPDLKHIIYSTYIGGDDIDAAESIVINRDNQAIITGITESTNFPIKNEIFSNNSISKEVNRSNDVFVTTFSSDGSSLVNSTYYGGRGHDNGDKIIINSKGQVVLVGWSESTDFPITGSAFQKTKSEINDRNSDIVLIIFGEQQSIFPFKSTISKTSTTSNLSLPSLLVPISIFLLVIIRRISKKQKIR